MASPAARRIEIVEFTPGRALASRTRNQGPWRPATVLIALGLAALAAIAVFVFTARSVLLEIEPSPDRLVLEGTSPVWELGGRYLLRPGNYALVAEKEGYRHLEVAVEVTHDPHQTFRFQLERLPGFLELSTAPVDAAEVAIDGELVGQTPLAVEIAPGDHEVRIRAERYENFVAEVSIEGGGSTQKLVAELVPRWAPVTFGSQPPGARISLDGNAIGKTQATVDTLAGTHTYELVLKGYKPYRGRLEVVANEPQNLPPVHLEPADGNLVLFTEPSDATVTIDGVYRGQSPLDLDLEPGREHEVRVSKSGYEARRRRINVRSEETSELRVALSARQGELRISSWPPDAELYVNGDHRGPATQTLLLHAVPQEIEIRKAGYTTYRRTLTPLPGLVQSIEVTLETREEAKARTTPRVLHSPEGHELRRIEPGRFWMGASRREPGRRANETLREVELIRPFYLASREVSNQQFRRFNADHLSGSIGGHSLEADEHPVVRVTWEEAAAYCNWLSVRENLSPAYLRRGDQLVASEPTTTGYRLPTEAEWAWATRFSAGKTALKFPWGETLPVAPGSGNYADASARESLPGVLSDYNDKYPVTAPVASFEPNAVGVFDLGGNVAEWVHDFYAIRPPSTRQLARDPFGPAEGQYHVIRGSGWMHGTVTELRLTYRDYGKKARPDVGFRIARYLE